jgi:hypothetical protein
LRRSRASASISGAESDGGVRSWRASSVPRFERVDHPPCEDPIAGKVRERAEICVADPRGLPRAWRPHLATPAASRSRSCGRRWRSR